MNDRPQIIAIVGPTASGKTGWAIQLAHSLGGEVISADSRQVYRGLDLGTGKVSAEEMQGIPHHLIDVADPRLQFNASDFVRLGRVAIADIMSRGKVPIIAGGTGMYIDALLGRIQLAAVEPNEALRAELESLNTDELHSRLVTLNPARATTVDAKNPRRLVRAIEIASAHNHLIYQMAEAGPRYDVQWIGINPSRDKLKEKIRNRLRERLQAGMLDEARRLHREGVTYERMEALGLEYRYMARHLQGLITYDEMVASLESEIVKYAKRQMTWFKKNPCVQWLEMRHTLPSSPNRTCRT